MNMSNLLYGIMAVILLAGCRYTVLDGGSEASDFFENARPVTFETIGQGAYGSYDLKTQNKVIENAADLDILWKKLHAGLQPLPDAPAVDFSRYTVVVTIMGTQKSGGYDTEITAAAAGTDRLGVRVTEIVPGDGCGVTAALTNPYHMVKIQRRSLDITFFKEETTAHCASS